MWQQILDALLKELTTNPDRVFSVLERILGVLEKHPDAVTALIEKVK
jgi:hypothetical protein